MTQPTEPGYYWATDKHGIRLIVEVFDDKMLWPCGFDNWAHVRDFTDFNGPLVERHAVSTWKAAGK